MIELDDYDKKIINKANKLLNENYEIKNQEDLTYLISELVYKCEKTTKEYEDLKQDIQDNYRPIPLDSVDMYG